MAGDWIKMRVDLRDDPAVIQMATILGCEEDLVVGKLHRVWSWAATQLRDGRASGITAAWVDRFVGVPGLAQAMADVGWLTIGEDAVVFPKFDSHMSRNAKERCDATVRQRRRRQDAAIVEYV